MPILAAVDLGQGITDAWAEIARFVPRLIGLVAILVIGHFIAKVLSKACDKALERVGFDKAVERGGIRKALAKSQYDASDILSKVVYYAVMFLALEMAFGTLGTNPISALLADVAAYLPKVFAAVVIIVVTSAIAAAVREMTAAALGGVSYGKTLANAAGGLIVATGIFAALNQLQIATAIVNGVFYAALASFVGITVIAVGGGGIKPMQQRWEQSLDRLSQESQQIRQQQGSAGDRIKERAEQRRDQVKGAAQEQQQPEVDLRQQRVSTQGTSGWDPETGSNPNRNPQGF